MERGPDRKQLGVGIVGAGFIGGVHAAAARRAGARVVGVTASTPDGSEEAAVRLRAERSFADAEALLAADDVDVVHVCTPNHLHVALAEAALEAGRHVVCEKPLSLDAADARRLNQRAEAAGKVATVPFVYRFYPLVREARARMGDIGPVRLVHGTYIQDWLSTAEDDNWRIDADHGGASRAFADIGSHWCDLVEFITGDRLAAVCAQTATAVPERVAAGPHARTFAAPTTGGDTPRRAVTTEDIALVLFRTARGVTGSLVVSQVSPGRKNGLRVEISGAEATLAFDQERPDNLWVGGRLLSQVVARDPGQLHASAAHYVTVPPGHPQGYQDCFDAFVADTYRAVAAGSVDAVDGLPGFADGARAVEITEAVLASAASGSWVDIVPKGVLT